MKKILFSAVAFAVVAVSAVAVAPTTSEAVPAFARQTGAACLNCHFQAIPRLAAFGRNFKMNAYRDMGEQALIEDEHLSLPAVFNASFLLKIRASTGQASAGGVAGAKGGVVAGSATSPAVRLQFPDESALLFGGRLGEHSGIFTEWDVIGGSMLGAKIAYVFDLDAGIVALALGTTDALGAPSIFNDPSNAITRNTRGIQTRARVLRQTVMHTGQTGFGVYGHLNDMVYFAIGALTPAGGFVPGNAGIDLPNSPYLRAAFTGEVAGMDAVIGGWYAKTNTLEYKTLNVVNTPRTEYGVDIQLQGDVGDISVGFYAPIVFSSKTTVAAVTTTDSGYMPYVNVAFGPAGVRLGYDAWNRKVTGLVTQKRTNFIVGAWYDVAQNLTLDLEHNADKTTGVGGVAGVSAKNPNTTLMLEIVY
jgi:hypothetical protein